MTNLQDARRIGILYMLEDVPDYERVSEFVTELQHEHKEVKALGFVKNKNLISRFLPKLSFDFFSTKDLTWFYKPVHTTVRDFIEIEFDILISQFASLHTDRQGGIVGEVVPEDAEPEQGPDTGEADPSGGELGAVLGIDPLVDQVLIDLRDEPGGC